MNKTHKAFTLVEMLIVMGIIIILMAVGIASGRFAIRRANKIEHQNAAEQIYQAAQSYYSDNREYPDKESNLSVKELVEGDIIGSYIDDDEGGSEATYVYRVDSSGQEMIFCVTLGGLGDENHLGIYCTGNGIGGTLIDNSPYRNLPSEKDMEYYMGNYVQYNRAVNLFENGNCSDWTPSEGWLERCTVPDEIITY